ncbi:MAG: DUF2167 domain-containing protein [Myxococcota bacterium]
MIAPVLAVAWLVFAPPGGDAAPEQAVPAVAAPAEEPNPFLLAVRARLSPEDAEAFDAMTDAELEALAAKLDTNASLTPRERAISDALIAVGVADFEAGLSYQTGDIELGDGLAVLRLGQDFRYLDPDQANRVLVEAWDNPPGPRTLGMILPKDGSLLDPDTGWGVVVTFAADGHVKDHAAAIDADALLARLQAQTQERNVGRVGQGYPPMALVGWAEAPHYDAATHRVHWAKEVAIEGAPNHALNYAVRILGRRGVLEFDAIATMRQLPQIEPAMDAVLSAVEFSPGHRYEDFDPQVDGVADYGIAGLVAGKAPAEPGLFAAVLEFLATVQKFLIAGAFAIWGLFRVLSRGRKNAPEGGVEGDTDRSA